MLWTGILFYWLWENDLFKYIMKRSLWWKEVYDEKKSYSLKIKVYEILLCFKDKESDENVLVFYKNKASDESTSLC